MNAIRKSQHSPLELSHRYKTHIDSIYDIIYFRTWIGCNLEKIYPYCTDYKYVDKHILEFYNIMGGTPRPFYLVQTKKGETLKFYINEEGYLKEIEGGWRRIEEFNPKDLDQNPSFIDAIEINQPEISCDEYIWNLHVPFGDDKSNVKVVKMSINPYDRSTMRHHTDGLSYSVKEFQDLVEKDPSILDMFFWENVWGTMKKTYIDPKDWSKTTQRDTDKTYTYDEFKKLEIGIYMEY